MCNHYFISEKNKKEFRWQLQDYQTCFNEVIEKSGIVKQSSKCHLEIPRTAQFFYRDRRAKDGLRPECIQCHKKSKKTTYHKKKENYLELSI